MKNQLLLRVLREELTQLRTEVSSRNFADASKTASRVITLIGLFDDSFKKSTPQMEWEKMENDMIKALGAFKVLQISPIILN